MRKTAAFLTGALAAAALIGPAFAADTSTTSTAPAKMAVQRHLTAEVVAVNAEAKTLTVKRSPKAKEMTLAVDPAAATSLADLKAGDRVKVTYQDEHGQLTAKTITKNEPVAAKK